MLAANAPDIDVLAYAAGPVFALGARRGWTHGILAIIVLPIVLAGLLWLVDRVRKRPDTQPARFLPLLFLSALGVVTHPLLDFLNVYGIRWLMPFSDRWFYGDTLFIVDPWMWAMLSTGVVASVRWRRSGRTHPERAAQVAIGVAMVYVVAMGTGGWVARALVTDTLRGARDARLMVGPIPLNPIRRSLVLDDGAAYRIGDVSLIPPRVTVYDRSIPKRLDAAKAAAGTDEGGTFLYWARFPFVEVDRRPDSTVVYIIDARYALDRDASFGAVRVALETPTGGSEE